MNKTIYKIRHAGYLSQMVDYQPSGKRNKEDSNPQMKMDRTSPQINGLKMDKANITVEADTRSQSK